MTARSTDINGTIEFDNGLYIYGTFTRKKEGVYELSNNTKIEIKENSLTGTATVTYTNSKGEVITIVVSININHKPDNAVRQLCRSWRMDSSEIWLYLSLIHI